MYDAISHRVVEVPEIKLQHIKRSLPVSITRLNVPYVKEASEDWVEILSKLVTNQQRNGYIIGEVIKDAEAGHKVLVMSERKQHCYDLQDMLTARNVKSIVLTSNVEYEDRKDLIASLKGSDVNIVIATTKLISEGANIPVLSCLHLTTPSNNFELEKQKIGRIRRVCEGKKDPVVRDYVENKCEFLERMAKQRAKHYRKLGFPITNVAVL